MSNPIAIATRGKGVFPMLFRGAAIANRYGFTPAKIKHAISLLSSTLEMFNCQATIPITAHALLRNLNLARIYQAQGLELAVHGFSHLDYRHLSMQSQIDHLHRAQYIFKLAGIKPSGYRSPYLRWNQDTLNALKACGFIYDSSQALDMSTTAGLETSAYHRVLEFYRAKSVAHYPALPRLEAGLVRIPYCLPDDESLVDRLKITDSHAMADLWLAMLDNTYQAGELFTLGLHPERTTLCQQALVAVLRRAQSLSPNVWIARLDEITAWYMALGQSTYEALQVNTDRFRVKIMAPPKTTILVRSLEVDSPTEAWIDGYRKVMNPEFSFQCDKYPFIGLSPICPPTLRDFLHHQGYLVEISTEAQSFSNYLERTSFTAEDERPLLIELDKSAWPLVRLARWPEAARCALAITGDVDAFTLLDFMRRILPA
jgi:hypothetical protein